MIIIGSANIFAKKVHSVRLFLNNVNFATEVTAWYEMLKNNTKSLYSIEYFDLIG